MVAVFCQPWSVSDATEACLSTRLARMHGAKSMTLAGHLNPVAGGTMRSARLNQVSSVKLGSAKFGSQLMAT